MHRRMMQSLASQRGDDKTKSRAHEAWHCGAVRTGGTMLLSALHVVKAQCRRPRAAARSSGPSLSCCG